MSAIIGILGWKETWQLMFLIIHYVFEKITWQFLSTIIRCWNPCFSQRAAIPRSGKKWCAWHVSFFRLLKISVIIQTICCAVLNTIVLVLWLFFHFLDHWKDYVSPLTETWCTNVLDLKKLSLVYTHKTIAMTLNHILVGEGVGLVLMELNA